MRRNLSPGSPSSGGSNRGRRNGAGYSLRAVLFFSGITALAAFALALLMFSAREKSPIIPPDYPLFMIPIEGARIPTDARLLPGAPRSYRNGTHRGIDFYVDYGTPVVAGLTAYVTRADEVYREPSADFWAHMVGTARRDPSDASWNVTDPLYGRQVVIDHGVLGGHHWVTRYAHLSALAKGIRVGSCVVKGQLIGWMGNSGTFAGASGRRTGRICTLRYGWTGIIWERVSCRAE